MKCKYFLDITFTDNERISTERFILFCKRFKSVKNFYHLQDENVTFNKRVYVNVNQEIMLKKLIDDF